MIDLDRYYITMDSFGDNLPDNWREIAEYLNDKIIDVIDKYCDDGDMYWATEPEELITMEHEIERVWDDYCMGRLHDAPKEEYGDEEEVMVCG